MFLIRQKRAKKPSKGLLIIDHNQATQYRELIYDFKNGGTKYGYINNVVDIPYFARCPDTRMLQLADFVASAVFQYYERNDSKHLGKIITKFDRREKDHPPDGLKHIIKTECECMACAWRRQTTLTEDVVTSS